MSAELNALPQRASHAPHNPYIAELGVYPQSQEYIHRPGGASAVPGISPHSMAYITKSGVHCRTQTCTTESTVYPRARCALQS